MRFRILFQCVFVHCRLAFLKISEMRFRYQLMRLRKTAGHYALIAVVCLSVCLSVRLRVVFVGNVNEGGEIEWP